MNFKYKILHTIGLEGLCGCLLLGSCTLDIPLEDEYSDPEALSTVDNARSLLTSAYLSFPHEEYEFSLLGPDFCPTSEINKDPFQRNLYDWQENQISKYSEGLWLAYYNVISTCDILQERFHYVITETQDERDALACVEAESNALEAMCYFNLLRLFAPAYDVNPAADGIILKNRVGVEFPKRSSLEVCVAEIRNLLLKALAVENHPETNGWLSQTAVRYLLAELELYVGNYEEAATAAQEILTQSYEEYFTERGYAHLWETPACAERIFGFNLTTPYYTSIQYDEVLGDYVAVSPAITFGEHDYRGAVSVYPFEMDGVTRRLLGKYNKNNKEHRSNGYLNMMRFAGAYFIAAEALSRLPGRGAEARQLINQYLGYCGAELLGNHLDGEALTKSILLEKQKEFLGEGVSYFDMKRLHNVSLVRWNRWGKMATSQIESNDYRWTFPIPRTEYRYNENVTQNAGWPINR